MRGKGTKLGEGERKVRLSQDRMTILYHSGLLRTFGICVYVQDFYDFWECYVRDCYVAPKNVSSFLKKKHFQSCFSFSKLWKNIIEMVVTCNYDLYEEYSFFIEPLSIPGSWHTCLSTVTELTRFLCSW